MGVVSLCGQFNVVIVLAFWVLGHHMRNNQSTSLILTLAYQTYYSYDYLTTTYFKKIHGIRQGKL